MKTQAEIEAQFAEINPLPVSEETLGAYLEGNLDEDEMIAVRQIIDSDDDFAGFVQSIDDGYEIEIGEYDTTDGYIYTGETYLDDYAPAADTHDVADDPVSDAMAAGDTYDDAGLYCNDDTGTDITDGTFDDTFDDQIFTM